MTTEEIKELASLGSNYWRKEIEECFVLAMEYLEDAAKHYNVQEGQRAIACLKAIESKFN